MSRDQQRWLAEHPQFKRWKPHGIVSMYGWTDVGYLLPNGDFVLDGKHHFWGGAHLMSSNNTLYLMSSEAMKIGREFMIT